MSKIKKEQRRIFRDDILPCSCGNTEMYVAWRFLHSAANKKSYAVMCDKCRASYTWRKTADRAVATWNDKHMIREGEKND